MSKIYEVYASDSFWEDYRKLSKEEQRRIDKIKEQLSSNPYVGKPLGYRFFRENRFNGKAFITLFMRIMLLYLLLPIVIRKHNMQQ